MNKGLLFTFCLLFSVKRLLRHLKFLQQEGYDPKRYLKWVFDQKAFDQKGTLIVFCSWFIQMPWLLFLLPIVAFFEENPLKQGKIKLNMTKRATRIFCVSAFILAFCLFLALNNWLFIALVIQAIPLFLALGVICLIPDEKRRQKNFITQAKKRLKEVSPFVIAITGSAGKTSTKLALAHLLQTTKGAVFYPKSSINTPMGIAKTIREDLLNVQKIAVIEMGAYQRGSIRRLCHITAPDAAIITEVGSCHLERFGSQENISFAKFELAEALKPNSPLILNGDNLLIRKRAISHQDKMIRFVGFDPNIGPLDTRIVSYHFSKEGTEFTFNYRGEDFKGKTPLLGKPALFNLAAAFTLATLLGVDPHFAVACFASMEPASNRLQLIPPYLHDAYNSNPAGFQAALDVMGQLPAKRRILMTPGMIELGPKQQSENLKIGHMAAKICDLVLIVNEINKKSLREGLNQGGMPKENIYFCCTRKQAFDLLNALKKPDDLILIENDLPDLYEGKAKW